jgi:hypothetical protein
MRALSIIIPILCVLVIAYRYYSALIAANVFAATLVVGPVDDRSAAKFARGRGWV